MPAIIQVGSKSYVSNCHHLPPIGAVIDVHKYLSDDGVGCRVEVLEHRWSFDPAVDDSGKDIDPDVSVRILTRVLK